MAVQEKTTKEVADNIVATNVTLEEYMAHYAADHCEWVDGTVIRVAVSHIQHCNLTAYLRLLLTAYFELKAIGRVIGQPFVLRLEAFPNRRREPDLFVVLNSNPHELKNTYMDGPADIVIEVVSEESVKRDHGEKFIEYEKGGVPEYWIVDPIHEESRFYRLHEDGRYRRQAEDSDGYYQTPALPGLKLNVPTLWQDELHGPAATARIVAEMLEG